MISTGYCQCGCGQKTTIAKRTDKRRGTVQGAPLRFVCGHATRGALAHHWNGGTKIRADGYRDRLVHSHPRADKNGRVLEHIIIAETAIGSDNRHENLVICPNHAYHMLLHQRQRSLDAIGNADWRKCVICKQYDAPENLHVSKNTVRHRACMTRESATRSGKTMLREIVARFGHRQELATVVEEINNFLGDA